MSYLLTSDGALNLDQVTRAVADANGGITFHFSDGGSALVGTVATTKAEALTALGLMLNAADIEIYDS